MVPITNPEVKRKIHQSYRMGYLKDVVLPRVSPGRLWASSSMHLSCCVVLTSYMHCNVVCPAEHLLYSCRCGWTVQHSSLVHCEAAAASLGNTANLNSLTCAGAGLQLVMRKAWHTASAIF